MPEAPLWFWITAAGALGLIFGSFLNVLVHRWPQGQSILWPGSHCPRCQAPIHALDNIPLLSFFLLQGRCRSCREPISWRYPLVEALSGLLWAGSVYRFGPGLESLRGAVLSTLLLALAALDWDHFWLPDRLTLPGIALGLGFQLLLPHGSWLSGLQGALLGAGLLLFIAGLWELLKGSEGMGLGDVKMLAMLGAFLGPSGMAISLLFGTLLGATFGLFGLVRGTTSLQSELPFGVFLAAGGWFAVFLGPELTALYLGLFP